VLLLFIVVTGYAFTHIDGVAFLVLFPLGFISLLVFSVAVSFYVSALNVRYRDVRHLLNIGLLVWFWATPIVYASGFVQAKLNAYPVAGVRAFDLYMLNPLASIVGAFQRALYGVVDPRPSPTDPSVLFDVSLRWLTGVVGLVLIVSLGLLWFAWRTFFRLSGDFAEEL
jgi:ABC-2 type transport system permease protein